MAPTRRLALVLAGLLMAAATVVACGDDGGGTAGSFEGEGLELGEAVFTGASPACANCHILSAADANGRVGPNLDESLAPAEAIAGFVRSGPGAMPSYDGRLSDEEIEAVAAYVEASSAAAQG